MQITATLINLFFVCHRQLWLHSHEIRMEHTSDVVYEGKLIHENSYPQRSERYEEVQIDGIKVDFYDTKEKVIHEIKKSDKIENAHEWQLKYYIYIFEKAGITGVSGILEYPKLRKKEQVYLSDIDRNRIVEIETDIAKILDSENCPPVIDNKICNRCSYFDFCYSGE